MAPGYLIALCLDAAGVLGLGLGLTVLRAERRARAGELARFLRSGQASDAVPFRVAPPPRTRAMPSVRMRTAAATSASAVDASDALAALRSAYAAPAR
ncbi:hypothetical protein [uncultured Methylobacterium sp.]|uniref:hypothetical protein n=1 Tax=uncultured Methylobacterium sp. TaxID=157278 RepID=UPI0035CA4550